MGLVEQQSPIPSVALGRLGPPRLSKLLFEAHLFKQAFGSMTEACKSTLSSLEISQLLVSVLESSGVAKTAPSIGIPVMLPNGSEILRGPRINVPELMGHGTTVSLGVTSDIEKWVKKGWIDLRPENIDLWLSRFEKMIKARAILRDMGSASASITSYLGNTFEMFEVVAWIFNNEMTGYRMRIMTILILLLACGDKSAPIVQDSAVTDTMVEPSAEPSTEETGTDEDGDGFTVEDGDCDDTSPWINPARDEEPADGVDNDCDGRIDEKWSGVTISLAKQGSASSLLKLNQLGNIEAEITLEFPTNVYRHIWTTMMLQVDMLSATEMSV